MPVKTILIEINGETQQIHECSVVYRSSIEHGKRHVWLKYLGERKGKCHFVGSIEYVLIPVEKLDVSKLVEKESYKSSYDIGDAKEIS